MIKSKSTLTAKESVRLGNHIVNPPSKSKVKPISELSPSNQRRLRNNFKSTYYQAPPEEKVMNSKYMKPWDKKPFFNDYKLFNSQDPDMIFEDIFNTMPCRVPDGKYDWAINKRLELAHPSMNSQEVGEEETNMSRANNQLDRMVIQQCVNSNGQVRILQETPVGTCSVPSQFQIDKISTFARITLEEAQIISKVYRILELGFKEVKRINRAIKLRSHGKRPWEVTVNKSGMTLLKLAQEIKALALEPQEDPEWSHVDMYTCTHRVIDDEAVNYNVEFKASDYDTYREEQWEPSNPVKEFTYWNNSVIPTASHLSGRKAKEFTEKLNDLEMHRLSRNQIAQASRWVKRNGSAAQKKKWNQSVHMITSLQAPEAYVQVVEPRKELQVA